MTIFNCVIVKKGGTTRVGVNREKCMIIKIRKTRC